MATTLPDVASTELATTTPERSVPASFGMEAIEHHPDWPLLARLPMRLTAAIPLPGFKVKNLLGLHPGQIVVSEWPGSEDVPLKIGSIHLSWSEFEVVEQRMAIRLTRLA